MKKYNSSLKPWVIWLIEHKLDFIIWPFWFILILPIYIIINIPNAFIEWLHEWKAFKLEKDYLIKEINKNK